MTLAGCMWGCRLRRRLRTVGETLRGSRADLQVKLWVL